MHTTLAIPCCLLFLFLLLPSCNPQTKVSHSPAASTAEASPQPSLPERTTVIFQDRSGRYWFAGSDQGVFAWDGKSMQQFTKQDGLAGNTVLGVQEDGSGRLYFESPEGVVQYDGHQFQTLPAVEDEGQGWALGEDNLWFRMGTNHSGPFRWDGELLHALKLPETARAAEFHAQYPQSSYNPYGLYHIYQDQKGHVWFCTASLGVCRYDGKAFAWLYEHQLTQTPEGGDFGMRSMIQDQNGHFWFCNTRYRYLIPAENEISGDQLAYQRLEGVLPSGGPQEGIAPYYQAVVEGEKRDLWMVTYLEGVWRKSGETLVQYPVHKGERTPSLFAIYKDRQGTIWLGSHNAGVFRFNGAGFEPFEP